MVVFPNAKINLGLDILSRREDGFHNISSVFYPLPFEDILEILPANKFQFNTSGLDIPGDLQNNLIVKAYNLLLEKYKLPPVQIHLHKIIPMGAGLGGGSADAAFAIKTLNDLFDLSLADKDMEVYAGKLGSDCPFFIKNKPVLAEGTGTIFSPVSVNLKDKYLALICPEIHVSTVEAYSRVQPVQPDRSVKEIIENTPLSDWKNYLKNDFEASVFAAHPKIEEVKNKLYDAGAVYASMSGSGSSVYGIYDAEPGDLPAKVAWKGYLP